MTGFKCNVTGSTSNVPLAKPQVPRRCGADPDFGKPEASPGNCTYGAKQPFYWFQAERNNVRNGPTTFAFEESDMRYVDVRGHLRATVLPRPVQLQGWRAGRHLHRLICRHTRAKPQFYRCPGSSAAPRHKNNSLKLFRAFCCIVQLAGSLLTADEPGAIRYCSRTLFCLVGTFF